MEKINLLIKNGLMLFIRVYQIALSPFFGYHCRFFPSCSQYTLEAIERYGIFRGLWLGIKRLLRCHPGCKGGVDLLPVSSIENIRHD